MKKPIWIVLAIAILSSLAIYLYIKKSGNQLNADDWRNFAVEDTASITKLFLADRNGNSALVERKGATWKVNGQFDARVDVIKYLLSTIKSIRTKSRVPKNARENVMKSLATNGVKIEIYTKDDEDAVKVYYVGGETPNQDGTYMMQEGSPEPFITEIPGFDGYLTPRYPALPAIWRDPVLFRYKPNEIAKIKVDYREFPQDGFELVNKGNQNVTIQNTAGQFMGNVDRITAQKYLGAYGYLVYEDEARGLAPEKVDSVIRQVPFAGITITDVQGKITRLSFYHIKNTREEDDENGNPILYNPDRIHARVNNERKLYVVQYYVWDRALVPASYFAQKEQPGQPKAQMP